MEICLKFFQVAKPLIVFFPQLSNILRKLREIHTIKVNIDFLQDVKIFRSVVSDLSKKK